MKISPRFLVPLAALASSGAFTQVSYAQGAVSVNSLDPAGKRVFLALENHLKKRVKGQTGGVVNVRIVPTSRAAQGHFAQIAVSGRNARIKKLHVSEFSLNAKNVILDVSALLNTNDIVTRRSNTALRAVISENDLTRTLAGGRRTSQMGLKVKYRGEQMFVTGNLNYTLINGPISGIGKLRRTPDEKVYLDILSLKLRGVEIPQMVKNRFSNSINPVIDYGDLPFNPNFKTVKVQGSRAILSTS